MANRCWLNYFRGTSLPASFVHLFFTIMTGRYSFVIAFIAIFPSPPWLARCLSFRVVQSETWRASWIDPSVVRFRHTLDLLPVPICSKIWEFCFDVNTVLDDPPINSGGATRPATVHFLAEPLARATTMPSPASV